MTKGEIIINKSMINQIKKGCELVEMMFEAIDKENIEVDYFSEEIKCFGELLISEGEFFKSVAEKKSQPRD